jgi:hypothetical protein
VEVWQAVRKVWTTDRPQALAAFLLLHFYRSPSYHLRLLRGTVPALQDGTEAMNECLEADEGRHQAGFDGAESKAVQLYVTREMLLCVSRRAGEVRRRAWARAFCAEGVLRSDLPRVTQA